MRNELVSLFIVSGLLIGVIYLFIRIALRLRRRGGSLTSVLFGATYEFYSQEKRKAVQQVVEQKAQKKRKEQGDKAPDAADDDPSPGSIYDHLK